MDCKTIGYAYDTFMTTGRVMKAVNNACLNVKDTSGIILRSDLESQYTNMAFEGRLAEKGDPSFLQSKGKSL